MKSVIDVAVDRTSAGDFEVVDGVQDIVFRGTHPTATDATIEYDTSGVFTVGTTEGNFTGSLDSGVHDGSNLSTGTVVTLSNAALTNKVDLVLNTAFDVDGTKSDGSLGLSGTSTTSFSYKVGTGTSATADTISVTINSVTASSLGLSTTNVTNVAQADAASSAISVAVDTLNDARARIGASQNRLEFAAANISTTLENMEAARSNLMDLDIAAEMSRFTSKQILVQAGVAMLAQANQTPQNLLQLFQ